MKNTKELPITDERRAIMTDNIAEELSQYDHSFPVLRTVYLILKGGRIEEPAANVDEC